jgi:hypothetical protein
MAALLLMLEEFVSCTGAGLKAAGGAMGIIPSNSQTGQQQ